MNRFRKLRKSRGLTQEDLGKILNVQKSTISRYEKGLIFPGPDVLKLMANYFNVSTDYLLGDEKITLPRVESDETDLLKGFRNLTQDGRIALLQVLNVLQRNNSVTA